MLGNTCCEGFCEFEVEEGFSGVLGSIVFVSSDLLMRLSMRVPKRDSGKKRVNRAEACSFVARLY